MFRKFLYLLTIAVILFPSTLPVSAVFVFEKNSSRTYNSKTYWTGFNVKTTEFHQKWIHFLDKNGEWRDIKTSFDEINDGFVSNNSPLFFTAPSFANETASFVSNNLYDHRSGSRIHADPFTQNITALGVESTEGHIETFAPHWLQVPREYGEANAESDAIVYDGAYNGDFEGDLIYWVNYATAPRLDKLVRIKSISTSDDLSISFRLEYDQAHKFLGASFGKKTSNGFSVVPFELSSKQGRGVGLKDFYVWDSGIGENKKREKIDISLAEGDNGSYILTKYIPQNFLKNATFPVYTDASSTFYPDAHVETNTVDGNAARQYSSESWSNLRDGAGNLAFDHLASSYGAYIYSASDDCSTWYSLYRSIYLFDTSSIGDSDTISSATFDIYVESAANLHGQSINMVSASPDSNTALASADYAVGDYGSTKYMDADVSVGSLTTSAYNTLTLNSSGLSNIDKTGVSKFSIRLADDIEDTVPGTCAIGASQFTVRFADYAGTSSDPILTITYATSASEFTDFTILLTLILSGYFVFRQVEKSNFSGPAAVG